MADTLVAGDGLCDEAAVRFTVEQGPAAIEWLLSLGVPFTPDPSPEAGYPYHLTREGGHGARRIIHAADATGQAVMETLKRHVADHPAIRILDTLTAIGLITDEEGRCRGARCLDEEGRLHELPAGDTVLATGGASGLYRHTTSPHPASGELLGQGIGNLVGPLFGGIAATGAIARTATNIRNGGNSPIAGVVHAIFLVLVLLLLAPLAAYIPLTVLAAILFMVAWNMSQAKLLLRLQRRMPRADLFIFWVTFALTVFADLVVAVNIGVILAMLYVLKRTSDGVQVRALEGRRLQRALDVSFSQELRQDISVLTLEGPYFFASVEAVNRALLSVPEPIRAVVVRLNYVPFVDATAMQALESALTELEQRNVMVALCEANEKVTRKLIRMGLFKQIHAQRVFDSLQTAWDSVSATLDHRSGQDNGAASSDVQAAP